MFLTADMKSDFDIYTTDVRDFSATKYPQKYFPGPNCYLPNVSRSENEPWTMSFETVLLKTEPHLCQMIISKCYRHCVAMELYCNVLCMSSNRTIITIETKQDALI